MTPVDQIAFQAQLDPERLAACELASGRLWSYAALDADVARCAAVLRGAGVGIGDRVAAFARNRVLLVVLHHACARIGALYVPLNWRLSTTEIAALIVDAEPMLLVSDDVADRGVSGWSIAALEEAIVLATPQPPEPIDIERPSLILYTSGTSGRPKGVLLSERAIAATAQTMGLLGRVTHESRFLCDSPMFHVIGLVTTIRPAFLHGGAIYVSDGFDAQRTFDRLADPAHGITHYFCVPQMARLLRAVPDFAPAKLAGLTGLFTGGAPNPPDDVRDWAADGIAVANGLGMSECGTVCHTSLDLERIIAKAGSVGVAAPGSGLRIVAPNGAEAPIGEPGELSIRGSNLFSGYWRRPAADAAAFTEDGWFRTGDIALLDADGWLWIVDRAKDMFISGGENVYPAEIESLLASHPDIAECAVVGIPDPRWGEVGALAIVSRGPLIEPAAILALIEDKLARYKLPRRVSIIPALPRNGAGKVLKEQLRRMLIGAERPAPVEPSAHSGRIEKRRDIQAAANRSE